MRKFSFRLEQQARKLRLPLLSLTNMKLEIFLLISSFLLVSFPGCYSVPALKDLTLTQAEKQALDKVPKQKRIILYYVKPQAFS